MSVYAASQHRRCLMKAWFTFFSLLLVCTAGSSAANAADASSLQEAARFEGVWRGQWNVSPQKIEFTFKRTEELQYDVQFRIQDIRSDLPAKVFQGKASYDPQLKRLKYLAIEFSWHEDGKRLIAKGTYDQTTNYALLKRRPAEEPDGPASDQ
jgi:hypothetical protein